MDTPNIAQGARFWGYHTKPDEATGAVMFRDDQDLTTTLWDDTQTDEDWWHQPTQILLSLRMSSTSGDRDLVIEVRGFDQFGFPVDEVIEASLAADEDEKFGTLRAYVHLTKVEIVSGSPLSADNTIRVPLPARVRDTSAIKGVQLVLQGRMLRPQDLVIDLPSQAVQFTLDELPTGDVAAHVVVVLDPSCASV